MAKMHFLAVGMFNRIFYSHAVCDDNDRMLRRGRHLTQAAVLLRQLTVDSWSS